MVKHQRRSHQKGMHFSELDDCSSESDGGESPTTPTPRAMSCTPHSQMISAAISHSLHRSASCADFDYGTQAQYSNRHSISTSDTHEYQDPSIPSQHGSIPMVNRMQVPSNTYYVTEQNNPAVATMNTTPIQQYQAGRPYTERPPQEIPCPTTNMNGPIQNIPTPFSPSTSVRGPPSHVNYYHSNQPTQLIDHQIMAQFQQQITMHALPQIPNGQPMHEIQEQFQQPANHHVGPWYDEVPYNPPLEVPTIGQLPTYGSGLFATWEFKDLDDPTMQMPSARIDNM